MTIIETTVRVYNREDMVATEYRTSIRMPFSKSLPSWVRGHLGAMI